MHDLLIKNYISLCDQLLLSFVCQHVSFSFVLSPNLDGNQGSEVHYASCFNHKNAVVGRHSLVEAAGLDRQCLRFHDSQSFPSVPELKGHTFVL